MSEEAEKTQTRGRKVPTAADMREAWNEYAEQSGLTAKLVITKEGRASLLDPSTLEFLEENIAPSTFVDNVRFATMLLAYHTLQTQAPLAKAV